MKGASKLWKEKHWEWVVKESPHTNFSSQGCSTVETWETIDSIWYYWYGNCSTSEIVQWENVSSPGCHFCHVCWTCKKNGIGVHYQYRLEHASKATCMEAFLRNDFELLLFLQVHTRLNWLGVCMSHKTTTKQVKELASKMWECICNTQGLCLCRVRVCPVMKNQKVKKWQFVLSHKMKHCHQDPRWPFQCTPKEARGKQGQDHK